jgi:hypothetical protein
MNLVLIQTTNSTDITLPSPHYHHHHHQAVKVLGSSLACSGLNHEKVSLKVILGSLIRVLFVCVLFNDAASSSD